MELLRNDFGEHKDFWFWFGNFLDSIYSNPNLLKTLDEPTFNDEKLNAFVVGAIHKLYKQHNMPDKEWFFKKKYFLKEPWFVGGFTGEYNIFLLRESPAEFRARNIFVGENILERA